MLNVVCGTREKVCGVYALGAQLVDDDRGGASEERNVISKGTRRHRIFIFHINFLVFDMNFS